MKVLRARGCQDNKVWAGINELQITLYKINMIIPGSTYLYMSYKTALFNKYSLSMRGIIIESNAHLYLNE